VALLKKRLKKIATASGRTEENIDSSLIKGSAARAIMAPERIGQLSLFSTNKNTRPSRIKDAIREK
ncbi:MAG TPA: hypothetical protein VLB84_09650, partial [Bacteroidia bacterium]|nr:hypothetical protein [Bacteroidia bacterium]